MRTLRAWFVRLGGMFHKARRERELAAELESHLVMHIEENVRAGMSAEEARRQALIKLGGLEPTKENVRDRRGVPILETIIQDARCGLRMLAKSPGFTAVAVLTLALGIGATTAIFSVVNGVLLEPLPYKDPGRLVQVYSASAKHHAFHMDIAAADYFDLKSQSRVFESAALYHWSDSRLNTRGEATVVQSCLSSADLFKVLGVKPALGRWFLADEDQPGKNQVAILSSKLWRQEFNADPKIIGKAIKLDDKPATIVGVMPPGFAFPHEAEIWKPLVLSAEELKSHGWRDKNMVARLKPGVTRQQAQAEMDTIAARLAAQYPADKDWGFRVVFLHQDVVGDVKPVILVLFGAVGFVLLIACANVANLSLARNTARQREIAVRETLGATRGRVVRQLMTESLLVALAGGALGLLAAVWGVELVRALAPADTPRLTNIRIDLWVLGFSFLASVVTGLVFGLPPALLISKPDLNASLKEGAVTSAAGRTPFARRQMRRILLVSEVALALLLLIGSGLMMRSFILLITQDPGFDTHHLLTLAVGLSSTQYRQYQQQAAYFEEALKNVRALPGVESAAVTGTLPLESGYVTEDFTIEGRPVPAGQEPPSAQFAIISPDYFRTLGMQMLKGRDFTARDGPESSEVAIINQSMAREFWPGADPMGKIISLGWGSKQERRLEIIGIVSDARDVELASAPVPKLFVAFRQFPQDWMNFVVRTRSNPLAAAGVVRGRIQDLDRSQPVVRMMSLDQVIHERVAGPRFRTLLLNFFAGLALVLALVGTYGTVSYSVSQRTHEIGVRMALGAEHGDVLRLVVGQGMSLVLAGIAVGLGGAWALTRLLSSFLYRVQPTDPVTFVVASLAFAGVALVASYLPARRATRVDPTVALRYE